jgi:FKBP-type peptidyl-prolyl cis-trans isomerase
MSVQTKSTGAHRGQAIAGVLSGVLVFAVLVVVFFVVRNDDKDPVPAAAPPASADPLSQEPEVAAGSGTLTDLAVKELVPGSGPVVEPGQTITVNYKLTGYASGEEMDSSWSGGVSQPFTTRIGTGQVIQGWDKGIPGQKVGSRIQLDVPQALAYGPEKGDLRFVVDILSAK